MKKTDLSEKIALLIQVYEFLDGDAATAGFQAWEHSLQRLNTLESEVFTAQQLISDVGGRTYNQIQDVKNELTTTSQNLDYAIRTVDTRLTNERKMIDDGINANFVAMKSKAAIIFAV